MNSTDERLLSRALDLAENGLYTTTPNPRVGCVLVRDGRIVAEGWHRRAGEAHAEALALRNVNGDARGASAYVTLEPCAHIGKTPSCAEALARARPARVVVALPEPNPQAAGGAAILRAAGVQVEFAAPESAVRRRATAQNVGFLSRMTRGRPWVRLKIAATLDGKTALDSGLSRWISNEESRRDAHRLRARSCAILTGVGTATTDNPRLTVRHVSTARQPLRVLVDSSFRAAPSLALFEGGNLLVAAAAPPPDGYPAETATLANAAGKVDLSALMILLARREINEVTVEAGRKLNGALLAAGLADEIVLYLAPRAFGGGKDMLAFPPPYTPPTPADAPLFSTAEVRRFGDDIKIVYRRVGKND